MRHSAPAALKLSAFAALILLIFIATPPSAAQDQQALPAMAAMHVRLNLTVEQESRIAPLLERRKAELQQTRTELNSATSRAQKRSVLRDARQAQDTFNVQVEGVLAPEQQVEWEKLRAEIRKKLKQRWQDARTIADA